MAKIALVTGASRGLGKAIVELLAKREITVIIGARNIHDGQQVADGIIADGGEALVVQLDVTNESSVADAAQKIRQQYGKLDFLVNNAGVLDFEEAGVINTKIVEYTYAVNVFGLVRVTELLLPLLKEGTDPRVVNISSEMGSFAAMTDPKNPYYQNLMLGYASSKAAVNAITVLAARILAANNIVVNAINPGFMDTDMTNHTGPRSPYESAEDVVWLLLDNSRTTGTFYSDRKVMSW
ncbi:MAG TPA: SDR family NAD(P)-dependent oxidoreductase [Candidatus Saccharimonadales bacterium]|nr:SDR family NAD(P)-dependent oxidoreductase [Candidatus Saccharimonadales bacterium]